MKMSSKLFTWHFHLKSSFSDFSKFSFFFEISICSKISFLHDENIFFVQMFFCDQVCISSNPRNHLEHPPCPHDDSEPPTWSIVGENWSNSPDSAFVIMCAPRNCPLFMSKSGAACLQIDIARSSRGVGRSNDYRYILTRTRTVHCARF